jgi:hypothetical protein
VKKLHLDLDDLLVETFQPAAAPTEGGTAAEFITQGANTCYHCTRWVCPDTEIC